jgi:hypothetical protein
VIEADPYTTEVLFMQLICLTVSPSRWFNFLLRQHDPRCCDVVVLDVGVLAVALWIVD